MSGPSATAKPISAKMAVISSIAWLIGWMRPVSTPGSGTGRVTSSASRLSCASSAARLSNTRRAARASVTRSFSALMAAPRSLRSSGASLPSVASSAEIDPFLPSAAMRAASSALSSDALSIAASVSRSRADRSDIPLGLPARPQPFPFRRGEGAGPPGSLIRRHKPVRKDGASFRTPYSATFPKGGKGKNSRGLGQRAFCLLDDRSERGGLGNGEIGQDLAVDLDPRCGEAGNKAAVGQPVLAHRRVDPLNPQSAKLALAVLAVAIGVLHRLVDRGLGGADGVLAPAKETLGGFQHFLVFGVGGYAPFDARHRSNLRERNQPFGRKNFLTLSPSVLNRIDVPRRSRICLGARLIMPWRLPRWA